MAKDSGGRRGKIGVRRGGGRPPGYRWEVVILDQVFDEARAFLSEDQYDHLARQVRELARQDDPSHSETIDVRPIGEFFEIRDKGGVLGKINARVFFFRSRPARRIVILGAIPKQNDGPTPLGDRRRMERRMRLYLENIRST
ncbi:MAG: hypothetical protein ACLQGP_01080 [Isosphaeraceae bacterium]